MEKSSLVLEKINNISIGIPNLSENILKTYAEASSFCLDLQGHKSGISMFILGDFEKEFALEWDFVDDKIKRTYNDVQEAIEWGATAISFLIIKNFTPFTVIERSRKKTGFDYWLGYEGDSLFQNKAKLEVSGILKESDTNTVKNRVRTKIEQIRKTNNTIPGFVIVVEFSKPLSEVRSVK